MIFDDENEPRKKQTLAPKLLDGWSVEDLEEYIAFLKTEITRAEKAIGNRQSARQDAESAFKS